MRGIISPLFKISTVSPKSIFNCSKISKLCNVTLLIIEPPSSIGSRTATGT